MVTRIIRRVLHLLLCFCLLQPGWAALADTAQDAAMPEPQAYDFGETRLLINPATGDLAGATLSGVDIPFDAAYVDFCYDGGDGGWEAWGCYLRNTLFYQNLDFLATYELPQAINYNYQTEYARRDPADPVIEKLDDGVSVTVKMEPWDEAGIFFEVNTRYTVHRGGYVMMDATLKNLNDHAVIINGASSVIAGLRIGDASFVELPGNLPYDVYSVSGMPDGHTIAGDFASPLVHAMTPDADINLIFADPIEKWKPSFTKVGKDTLDVINLACAIDKLEPGETLSLGTQFLQAAPKDQGYQAARALYTSQGWVAPTDGVRGANIYSGHPAGVSDNNFVGPGGTLADYQQQLEAISALGFDALWMLPVFEHPSSGGSLYLPYNMEYIDARYAKSAQGKAGDEARQAALSEMADFGKAATDADLLLMIDYVPHGPYKYNPDQVTEKENIYDNPWMTEDRAAWRSWDRWYEDPDPAYTHDREEWNCYAFDFSNTQYLQYMRALAQRQAQDFFLAGTRIDAVMGTVPNWQPEGDHRVSQSGLFGGAEMTKAIRQGFLDAGVTPLVLPENNNPTPYYAPYTDLFYDMPFLRASMYARKAGLSEQKYAAVLAHWLKAEQASAPEGLQFGRFLENHDTVAPWYGDFFDAARATEVYGAEKARAMWTLLATIDGSLIIYQNDEIGNEQFFTDLLAMRKAQFGADNALSIEYLNDASSGIVALRRYGEGASKLVLVNLTSEIATRDFSSTAVGGVRLSTAQCSIVYGDADIQGDLVALQPYQCAVIDLAGGDAFDAPNTAAQFNAAHIKMQLIVEQGNARNAAAKYQSFPISKPEFAPGAPSADGAYDPVAEYSKESADGAHWKYLYVNAKQGEDLQLLTALSDDAVGVWRVGELDGAFRWAGCGVNTEFAQQGYFELDSDIGSGLYGVLAFVAPEAGSYDIPAFRMHGVGEAETAILVTLINGEQQGVSNMLEGNLASVQVDAQRYELEAGDVLMFYAVRMDKNYTYVELEGLKIQKQ